MWRSLSNLVANRSFLSDKKEKLERFAIQNREKFSIIGSRFGDDIAGLEWNENPNELYVNSFHVDKFFEEFKTIVGKFLTVERFKSLEENIGWASNLIEIELDVRITKTNEFDTDDEKTKLFHEFVQLNHRRNEILNKLKQ